MSSPTPRRGFLPLAETLLPSMPVLTRDLSSASLRAAEGTPHNAGVRRTSTWQTTGEASGRGPGRDRTPRRRSWGNEDGGSGSQRPRSTDSSPAARKGSVGWETLLTPQIRSMRLIGNSNPRYQWEKYYKSKAELSKMRKPVRKYYEKNNYLISQYLYIDRLLDSSLPHNLIQEYAQPKVPQTIEEEPNNASATPQENLNGSASVTRIKRTPKTLYKVPDEDTPLLHDPESGGLSARDIEAPGEETVDSSSRVVSVAIAINFTANAILLAGKIFVIVLTSSLSVLASLVDAALDFLSTAIVFTTTKMIGTRDQYSYPIGRSRLEPIGVLVFSVVMITSFAQVALQCIQSLVGKDHSIVQLGIPSIAIMIGTVVIKGLCWFWCRLINNSSVQALAQDAVTDVVFNTFSIIFPIVGFYAKLWWLDALGGLMLSLYVIINWARTSGDHIRNLSGAAASADDRNVLLYLTMRFAKCIKEIQGLQAYHSGDKLNVEVDIVLDEGMKLRDSHDLGESLQYVLESVPVVERAFVHMDYAADNLPGHMVQQE